MRIRDLPPMLYMEVQDDTRMPVNLLGVPAEHLVLLLLDAHTGAMREGTGMLQVLVPALGHVRYHCSEGDKALTGEYRLVVKQCGEEEDSSAFYRVSF